MFNKNPDLFDLIENTKIIINNKRKDKKQTIKEFLLECQNESKGMTKNPDLILK